MFVFSLVFKMVETEEEYLEQMEILVCFSITNVLKYTRVGNDALNNSGLC